MVLMIVSKARLSDFTFHVLLQLEEGLQMNGEILASTWLTWGP